MADKFKDIAFPDTLEYRSDNDNIPLEFYISVIPISKVIDMHLGFFRSNAIEVLNMVFAQFIFNGGTIRLIVNNILSPEDRDHLLLNTIVTNEARVKKIFESLSQLRIELNGGQHFFDCLKYLINENRLIILPVVTQKNTLSHYKNILFYDNYEDALFTEGSANFTANGILTNGESFNVSRSWGDPPELKRIEKAKVRFERIISKKHDEYYYLDPKEVKVVIDKIGEEKSKEELIIDSSKIPNRKASVKKNQILSKAENQFLSFVKKLKETPRFPYPQPRSYQSEAYQAWIKNNYKGIFAMATGTGKTLTALYCLIKEYEKNKIQKNIFVVPGEELVRQWRDELKLCNFKNVFLWYSKNNNLRRDIENIRVLKESNSINVIVTYDSLKTDIFLSIFSNLLDEFVVVFDEVHNMGAVGFRKAIAKLEFVKIIGLSATPLRMWDDDNENEFIELLFNSLPPHYTYSFPMEKAIGKFLVKYNYYPYFTHLTHDEFEKYLKYTAQIPIGKNGEINTTAALKRQLLLDQASNKADILLNILKDLINTENYYWTLVYCPKGRIDDIDEERIIHKLGEITASRYPSINVQFFVGETQGREILLKDFENKDVHMLFAIKVLDEGVNVPMAQNAIFLASGKNYREFVQRRGRILRKYKSGNFEKTHANIYDIVVLPTKGQYYTNKNASKRLIISEFKRLFEFYKMAIPNKNTFWKIENELKIYGLTQYYIENILEHEQGKNFERNIK